jgi:hypothetical protein
MTRAHRLLAELATRGVSLHFDGAHLRLYPRSALTDALIAQLLDAKAEILAVLRSRQTAAGPSHTAAPALPPLHWWLLCALAHAPHLSRAAIYTSVPAPRPIIDRALAALIRTRELRATADGRLDLNIC